jgi:hypothetical protein
LQSDTAQKKDQIRSLGREVYSPLERIQGIRVDAHALSQPGKPGQDLDIIASQIFGFTGSG